MYLYGQNINKNI